MVTIENITRRPRHMVTLNLTKAQPVRVTRLTQVRTRQGGLGTKISEVVVPDSVHIPVGRRSALLPDSVKDAPEVKAALARKWIKIHEHGDTKKAQAKTVEKVMPAPTLPETKPGDFKMTEEGASSSKATEKGASPTPKTRKKRGK